jgi:methanogenic corrinoid protein MtbC1
MKSLLTPKQVARAIQVSESSVKRWCDKGTIPTQYTAGGHRRIPINGFLDFLRASKHALVRPEVLGLPATTGQTHRVIDRGSAQLTEALIQGDEEQARQIILDLYLAEHSLSVIGDQVVAAAFESIGDRWQCGEAEVYQERRGCEIALRVVREMRMLLPDPTRDAPLAIGGAAEGDQYSLATSMVELVLRDRKWNAISMGDNLPFATLSAAIRQQRPVLFWLSVSHIVDEESFLRGYNELFEEHGREVAFVVGGRHLTESLRQKMRYAAYCDNLQHLDSFAQTLRGKCRSEPTPST